MVFGTLVGTRGTRIFLERGFFWNADDADDADLEAACGSLKKY
jgi:hypothetical protein